jgi:NTP pyrophosphatase (non-canonical NTP hydrolase)
MISDSTTTLHELKHALEEFRDAREWAKFYDPKNLAEAISTEASELLQLFLWKQPPEITEGFKSDRKFRKEVEEELADVFCFCLNLANALGLDVSNCVRSKIAKNAKRYPVSKARGVATKYKKL